MSDDTTPKDDAPKDDVEPKPADAAAGGKKDDEPEVFDRAYVEQLRKESAGYRTRAQAAESKAKEFEDRDKTDLERANDKATAAEQRATTAEAKVLRGEVADDKDVPAKYRKYLTGSTREELEASADEIIADFGTGSSAGRGPDPAAGRRPAPPATQSMDDRIRARARG